MENRIGEVIRKKREEIGLTQEKLAELVGVSTGFIGQVERGLSNASSTILGDIIVVLALDANTLFYNQVGEPKLEKELTIMLAELEPEIRDYIVDSIRLAYRKKRYATLKDKS